MGAHPTKVQAVVSLDVGGNPSCGRLRGPRTLSAADAGDGERRGTDSFDTDQRGRRGKEMPGVVALEVHGSRQSPYGGIRTVCGTTDGEQSGPARERKPRRGHDVRNQVETLETDGVGEPSQVPTTRKPALVTSFSAR